MAFSGRLGHCKRIATPTPNTSYLRVSFEKQWSFPPFLVEVSHDTNSKHLGIWRLLGYVKRVFPSPKRLANTALPCRRCGLASRGQSFFLSALSFAVLGSSCSDGPPAHPLLCFLVFLLCFFLWGRCFTVVTASCLVCFLVLFLFMFRFGCKKQAVVCYHAGCEVSHSYKKHPKRKPTRGWVLFVRTCPVPLFNRVVGYPARTLEFLSSLFFSLSLPFVRTAVSGDCGGTQPAKAPSSTDAFGVNRNGHPAVRILKNHYNDSC